MNEREYFLTYKGKYATVFFRADKIQFRYNGIIHDVLEDKIIFHDRKLGQLMLTFKDLTVVGVREPTEEEYNQVREI
jgi:hypothetical protein